MANIVTEYEDFKRETAEVVNKHLNSLPAVFICDFLDKMNKELRLVAEQQLKTMTEKESEENDSE